MDSVLCCANAQSMKYYFNEEEYGIIPDEIKNSLKAALVSYCADVGGVILLAFDDDHKLHIQAIDPIDDIGSELKVRRLQEEMRDIFQSLEEFAKSYAELMSEGDGFSDAEDFNMGDEYDGGELR